MSYSRQLDVHSEINILSLSHVYISADNSDMHQVFSYVSSLCSKITFLTLFQSHLRDSFNQSPNISGSHFLFPREGLCVAYNYR